MIDLKKLSALEKAAKRGPWYAWLKPVHTPDKCITTVPAEQFLCEYDEAEKFNAELRERIGRDVVSYEWKDRHLTSEEEVIGCSECVEMRNQLPDLIAYIDRLVAQIERLREKADQQAARIAELEARVAALKKIAEEERAYIYSLNVIESMGVDEHMRTEARRQLAEEHPEAFG